ncbi:hypothetical protein GALMADRAFT_143925 [Galerina marginata CBS 339.88]|uniref:Uncharacterized protein n=1 Tax=Galerina marginata (strain CBS 339.88) TaxID=685588 RepID=A0A067SWR2_GALM3|nr:hypothetical protein GALMADRAFT_143925 [Galerina marginata CBS 339.88]
MNIKVFLAFCFGFCATQVLALDFANSKWIWTKEVNAAGVAPAGSRAFRRDFYSPQGKTALSANIIIAADNGYTLYVNGAQIGSGHSFKAADAYCIRLAPECNVFAVNATNDLTVPNPAGLLATIQIKYTDGFTETIVTDPSWHAFTSVPAGFQNQAFDDSAWPPATVEANFGAAPWGAVSIPPSASSTPLSLADANWIWTNEIKNGVAPIGARAFRKTIVLPAGQAATSADIVIGTDDQFTLYVQGKIVGSGVTWSTIHRFAVDIQPAATEIDIAVYASNGGGAAGVIAVVDLTMEDCDCGSVMSFVTDGTWKYNTALPVGFQAPGFDDSKWPAAIVEGKYGMAPWGKLAIPAAVSPTTPAISGAPAANAAKVVT